MEVFKSKKRNPELLTDWNGHAVQCFFLGGETLLVNQNNSFEALSTLIRVSNVSSSAVVFLKRSGLGGSDPGTPLMPYTSEVFYVLPGEIYTILGANAYVTFIRDRDA